MTVDGLGSISWVRVVAIATAGVLVWLLVKYLLGVLHRTLIRGEVDLDSEKRALTLIRAIRYAGGVLLAAIVLMLLLAELGVSIAPLLGAAGIAGVALGLAAQGVARDLLGGISLLLDNQLRVGDAVEIGGRNGIVEAVTLRSVKLREYDGTVHFVRTGEIGTVTNRSLVPVYAVLDVSVDSDADVGTARGVIEQAAEAIRTDAQLAPQVFGLVEMAGLERWDGDTIVIRARLPVAPGSQAPIRREWLARVRAALEDAGVPNPTQRIQLLRNTRPQA
jgi:small conductance mechanosensitive channel